VTREYHPHQWHDDTLRGLQLEVGDPYVDDWRANLVLDIDHITAWEPGEDGRMQFRVAPATLTFHHVTDLRIGIDWGDSGHRTALHPCAIDRIERAQVPDQKICLDRPYWRWRIVMNWPRDDEISFGASEFALELRADPILQDQQHLYRPPD
jgi:hypothetical protein